MSIVFGHVVVRETGEGVANLVVSVGLAPPGAEGGQHSRLGSTVTRADGGFTVEHEPPEDGRQWRMIVTVSPPDDCGTDPDEDVPVLAACGRDHPAAREHFHIRIAAEKLHGAGVVPTPSLPDPKKVIAGEQARHEYQEALDVEARRVMAETLTTRKQVRAQAKAHFTRFLRALSATDAERAGNRYVSPDGSVDETQQEAQREDVTEVINKMGLVTFGVFTSEQLSTLREQHDHTLEQVPSHAVEEILWPLRGKQPPTLVGRDLTWWCHSRVPVNDCVAILHEQQGDEPEEINALDAPPPEEEDDDTPATVPELITRLTKTMTSPEEKVLVGLRPALDDIQGEVDGFLLRSGPADVPATYDFHRMEIAFESVWQELFDKGVLEFGRILYEKFVELGLDPNEYLLEPGEIPTVTITTPGAVTAQNAPEPKVTEAFEITHREWNVLDAAHQNQLRALADELQFAMDKAVKLEEVLTPIQTLLGVTLDGLRRLYNEETEREARPIRAKAARIIKYAKENLQAPRDFDQFHELLAQLGQRLKEPYRFDIYAVNRRERSVNFGVLVTYRQKWTPVTYQVGELVRTVPLAPREVRRYTRRMVRKLSRLERESRSTLESLRTESSETVRAEAEIVARARAKTNYEIDAKAGVDLEFITVEGATRFSQETEQESQETRKEFREAVFKAATEYRSEHRLEVETSDTSEYSEEESGEISNPNDELPVTYLFYELQRRYRIEEKQHKVTPVILVAQEFDDEIDEDWIVAHDWILRQHALHPSMIPAMDYLATKVVGDEHALEELYTNLQQQRKILDQLTSELTVLRTQVASRYEALQRSMLKRADAIEAENNEGFFQGGIESLFGGLDADPEAMKAREDAAKDAYERLARQERDLTARLERETTAVAEAASTYTSQLSEHLNRKTQISRLRVHIKANLFHYMQAVYAHEPPDQRYFRLRNVRVPRLAGTKTYSIVPDPDAVPMPPTWQKPYKLTAKVNLDIKSIGDYDRLGDIADLDNLLGFKGNYMVFPLRRNNALTDFMMTPYYDPFSGIRDPDQLATWTPHEFAEYVCCLRKHSTDDQFAQYLPGLTEAYRRLRARTDGDDELVVPTGSLYIEALPGAHPILEDFKLAHRAIDVKKAQAETRKVEMENLRLAARLLEGEREDPFVEKKVVIDGAATPAVNVD